MGLTGLILAPFTAGASLALTIGGTAMGVAGGATTLAGNNTSLHRIELIRSVTLQTFTVGLHLCYDSKAVNLVCLHLRVAYCY